MTTKRDLLRYDSHAVEDLTTTKLVEQFLEGVSTLETLNDAPVIIFQDGASKSYYIKTSLTSNDSAKLLDFDARLDFKNSESFRANRELLLTSQTFRKMKSDAQNGREFNDIIVEFNTSYAAERPLKVWGGQHRGRAITDAKDSKRYHGFKIYFNLTKDQRTDLALISNTSIAVSNDTFDRLVEETLFGNVLRQWCHSVGLLKDNEDFPDVGSKSEKITVKKARSFIVNFYLGKDKGNSLAPTDLDKNVYEPYLVSSGPSSDDLYKGFMQNRDILGDETLREAGKKFATLHNAQRRAVEKEKSHITNKKTYRNKAFVESVLCGWSYVAGLLQSNSERLANHYAVPKTSSKIPDPLNADEMSKYKHDSDAPTYRGLGTRSELKDRQRIAQLFLAKSLEANCLLDKRFLDRAVSQVVGLLTLQKGYK